MENLQNKKSNEELELIHQKYMLTIWETLEENHGVN